MSSFASDAEEGIDGDGWVQPLSLPLESPWLLYVSVSSVQAVTVRVAMESPAGGECLPMGLPNPARASFILSPQPADEQVRLSRPLGRDGAVIIGMHGRPLGFVQAGAAQVDTRDLPDGVYLLRSAEGSACFVVAH